MISWDILPKHQSRDWPMSENNTRPYLASFHWVSMKDGCVKKVRCKILVRLFTKKKHQIMQTAVHTLKKQDWK